jgi:hypothetical protein
MLLQYIIHMIAWTSQNMNYDKYPQYTTKSMNRITIVHIIHTNETKPHI